MLGGLACLLRNTSHNANPPKMSTGKSQPNGERLPPGLGVPAGRWGGGRAVSAMSESLTTEEATAIAGSLDNSQAASRRSLRAVSKRRATSGQLNTFQQAPKNSAFRFWYCR